MANKCKIIQKAKTNLEKNKTKIWVLEKYMNRNLA